MKKENKKLFYVSAGMLITFILWTGTVQLVDVEAIGPKETTVGFARINQLVHDFTGVHNTLYMITDWLGLVPLGVVCGFALLGLVQWIQRKHFLKVDYSILVLGGFYIVVMAVFVLFEVMAVNYRPVLIDGVLEASYPSSTTMLVLCVMPTAFMQMKERMKGTILKRYVALGIIAFTIFMVVGRLISGVHWVTDIIGGVLLSAGLVILYRAIVNLKTK